MNRQTVAFAQCLQHQQLLQWQCMHDLAVSLAVYVAVLKLAKFAPSLANSGVFASRQYPCKQHAHLLLHVCHAGLHLRLPGFPPDL